MTQPSNKIILLYKDINSSEEHKETCSASEVKGNALKSTHLKAREMEPNRVSMDQLEAMFDFFDKHPHLARGVTTGMGSQHEIDRLWAELSRRLNSKGRARKTPHHWKKYWSTLKCRIKKKAAGLQAGMGGALSPLERRVMAILGNDITVYEANETKQETEDPRVCTSPAANTDDDDFGWPSEEEVDKTGSPPPPETPKRPRGTFVRGRPSRTRAQNNVSGFEPWLISLERRRVAAEEKMAAALKTMADAALLNAQTLRMCAQACVNLRTNGHTNVE